MKNATYLSDNIPNTCALARLEHRICCGRDATHNSSPDIAPHDNAHIDTIHYIPQDNACLVHEHDKGADAGTGVDSIAEE